MYSKKPKGRCLSPRKANLNSDICVENCKSPMTGFATWTILSGEEADMKYINANDNSS